MGFLSRDVWKVDVVYLTGGPRGNVTSRMKYIPLYNDGAAPENINKYTSYKENHSFKQLGWLAPARQIISQVVKHVRPKVMAEAV